MYIADGGYYDGYQWAETPDGTHDFAQCTFALTRAHHEMGNRRFKVFNCLKQQFRHALEKHGSIFRAVAAIVQIGIASGVAGLFGVEYEETEF